MTETDIKKIKIRLSKTSSGQWVSMIEGRDHTSGDSFIMTGITDRSGLESESRGPDIYLSGATSFDQDFIAHARQDIPALLAEIERLKNLL